MIFTVVTAKNDPLLQKFFKKNKCDSKCTFSAQNFTMGSFPQSCSQICSNLIIDDSWDFTEDQLTFMFRNVKTLIGSLEVKNTNFTSGKFLAGLEKIVCYNQSVRFTENSNMVELSLTNLTMIVGPGISVSENSQMTKLNILNLKNFSYPNEYSWRPHTSIFTNHPSLCITTQEMQNFMESESLDTSYIFIDNYCDPPQINTENQIFGDVNITTDSNLDSFKSIEFIFGGLLVQGRSETDLSFLASLKYVANLKGTPAISIQNNGQLESFAFPVLKKIHSLATDKLVFDYNNDVLSTNFTVCFELRNSLNLAQNELKFDWFTCEGVQKMNEHAAALARTTTTAATPGTPKSTTTPGTSETTTNVVSDNFIDILSLFPGFTFIHLFRL